MNHLIGERALTVRRALCSPFTEGVFALRTVRDGVRWGAYPDDTFNRSVCLVGSGRVVVALTSGDLNAQTAASRDAFGGRQRTTAHRHGHGHGDGHGHGRHGDHAHDVGHEPHRIVESDRCGGAWECRVPLIGLGMNPMNGVFMNPMAAPYMLGYPMSTNQIGAMMMMNQMGTSGVGSGQMSGVRPGAGQQRGRTKHSLPAKPPGTTATPGGLASRYFNRTTAVNRPAKVSRIPQNYYARQNRYYPQVAR